MYATALQYPVELFTEDVELEADLGVDSAKKTELLSHAAARYHPPEQPEDFRLSEYSTISKVADFVSGALMTRPGVVRYGFHPPSDENAARLETPDMEQT